ncbi:MAG TPA: carboxypeptidase-like regulatory domain-containing protein [Bryobacteraceae bacterium]|nr:carboxypeptidase-like regulatory domain-containing protein [Bryobacteraceae bacterium]
MNRRVALFVFFIVLATASTYRLRAQVSGATISGLITDAQGGAIANAQVSARNTATGLATDTNTNSAGAYTIPNLIPGEYQISAGATGFSTAVTKATLSVGQKQEINLALAVGQVSTQIEVAGAAQQVELSTSTMAGNVNATTVRELPLNGRDWASLATLEPSVVQARTHLDVTHVGGGGGRGFGDQLSVGGARPTQNSYRLDGAIVNDYSNAGPGSVLGKNLGVDAIQEFTVLTSNYSAEYGFTSGGVINAITRSGTNAFHGAGFDFLRNDKLDAANFFTNANGLHKNALRQNQFGGSAGWRLFKDRTFLFGAYEGVRRSAGLPVVNCGASACITISDAVRAGNVTNLATGAIVHTSIDPTIQKYLALYPHPSPGAGCVLVTVSGPLKGQCNPNIGPAPFVGAQKAVEDFFTFRADQKITDKDTAFVTFLRDPSNFATPLAFNNVQQSFTSYRQAVVAEETHVFNPAWANSFRAALDRTNNLGGNSPTVVNPVAGDPSLGQQPGFYSSAITMLGPQVSTLPGGKNYAASVQDFWGQIFQVYDDAFATLGKHGLKFGFAFLAYQVDGYTPLANGNGTGTFSFRGQYMPGGPGPGGQTATAAQLGCFGISAQATPSNLLDGRLYDNSCAALVNFLTDQALRATRPVDLSAISKQYLRDKIFSGYVQDDWRLRPGLTLNIGLRYEFATIPTEKNGRIAILPSPTTPLPCQPTPTAADPSCSAVNPTSVLRNSFWTRNPTTKNFEPRFGFAWDPFHNGKTAVRGGFGIFDALPLPYELILNSTSQAPYRATFATLGDNAGGLYPSPPAGAWPFGVPALTNIHVNNPLSRTWRYLDANIKRNYIYQYNFNIQRQLTDNMTLLVGYTGSRGFHNPFQDDSVNTVIPTKVPGVGYVWPVPYSGSLSASAQAARLLNPTTSNIMYNTMWQSRSWYNGMLVRLDKRLSHGFQLLGSFTWSKSIDDSSGSTAGDTFQLDSVSEPWYDMSLNKGLSDFDVRRNLVISGVWNVPAPKAMGAFAEKALGGWQLGLITTLADGIPMPISFADDIAGEVITTVQPPYTVPGCTADSMINPNFRHSLFLFNPNCFSLVPRTAANAAYCDSSGRGFSPALAASTCANIRGNLGRDVLIGPGLFNMDFSVFKNNFIRAVSENFNVQFRAEMFNILNHTNFAPSNNLSPINADGTPTSSFGQLTSTQTDNRQIQLALKVIC